MIEIGQATPADLEAISDIEQRSSPNPWPKETWQAELNNTWARVDIARSNDEVIGFCNYWVVPPELHLHAIATRADLRDRGVGSALLRHMLERAAKENCNAAWLEVRASNAAAISLYQRAGFTTVRVRARYYSDNDEDALVMSRRVP